MGSTTVFNIPIRPHHVNGRDGYARGKIDGNGMLMRGIDQQMACQLGWYLAQKNGTLRNL